MFHWAFLVLLLGAIIGKGTGYSGRATIVEQETWTDAAINYDPLSLRSGRYFDGEHTGLGLHLVDYDDDFDANGLPTRFASEVELLDPTGAVTGAADGLRERPGPDGDLRIHQYGFGWAPVVTVTDGGEAVFDGPIVMSQESAPEGRSQLAQTWHGFVKLPGAAPAARTSRSSSSSGPTAAPSSRTGCRCSASRRR